MGGDPQESQKLNDLSMLIPDNSRTRIQAFWVLIYKRYYYVRKLLIGEK